MKYFKMITVFNLCGPIKDLGQKSVVSAAQYGNHQPYVVTEHSELRCVILIKYKPDFKDLVGGKTLKNNVILTAC